jgi:hypothetical protein
MDHCEPLFMHMSLLMSPRAQFLVYGIPTKGQLLEELDADLAAELAALAGEGPTPLELQRYKKVACPLRKPFVTGAKFIYSCFELRRRTAHMSLAGSEIASSLVTCKFSFAWERPCVGACCAEVWSCELACALLACRRALQPLGPLIKRPLQDVLCFVRLPVCDGCPSLRPTPCYDALACAREGYCALHVLGKGTAPCMC